MREHLYERVRGISSSTVVGFALAAAPTVGCTAGSLTDTDSGSEPPLIQKSQPLYAGEFVFLVHLGTGR